MRVITFYLLCLFLPIYFCSSSNAVRFCGRSLAEALAIVCSERGYNMAFRPGAPIPTDRRYRRGIVDECCHNGCSFSTLESYCSEGSSDDSKSPPYLQISKRSDSHKNMNKENKDYVDDQEMSDQYSDMMVKQSTTYQHNVLQTRSSIENIDIKSDGTHHHKRKLFGHIDDDQGGRAGHIYPYSLDHHLYRKATGGNKVKRNEMRRSSMDSSHQRLESKLGHNPNENSLDWLRKSENDFISSNRHPTIRHHKERFSVPRHRVTDLHVKKNKVSPTSQVGTISPYFLGHTLVSKSTRKSFRY
ncbi:uncharacterized protein LOC106672819 [Cimex lectularius]|uniref:Insulin-like domain-containing protein n=1 Tax=Cimex lectularius TaxID=79782 RepID=A0A8I6S7D5_CIMLE|nr:uncharacterized protein LOC106672819 [Cimex lectularius]